MKTVSVILHCLTPATTKTGTCNFYPSDYCLQKTSFFKCFCLTLVMTILLQRQNDLFSLSYQLHSVPRFLICFPKRKIKLGFNAVLNQLFCLHFSLMILLSNTWVLCLLLLTSGDVHPNQGPHDSSSASSFSVSELSRAAEMMDHVNIVHLNIQSLYPKLDILETEIQYYDIVVLTEPWLTPNRKNDEIMIPNFDIPYRKDRNDRVGGGVAIYIKSGISLHKARNLIDNEIE